MAGNPADSSSDAKGWRWWVQHIGGPLIVGSILLVGGKLWDDSRTPDEQGCDPGSLSRIEGVTVTADSTLPPEGEVEYTADHLTDNDPNTIWVEGDVEAYGEGEQLRFVLPTEADVQMICVVNGYARSAEQWAKNARVQQFTVETDRGSQVSDLPDKPSEDFATYQPLDFAKGKTTQVTLTLETARAGSGPAAARDTSISDVQFWGRR